jgi:hypothetical protein
VIVHVQDSYATSRHDDLRGEHSDEFVLGYELAFGGLYTAGIRGVYRTLREKLGVGFDPSSGGFMGGNPGRGGMSFLPRPKREYSALEATLERAQAENLEFAISYVLSRNYGNYTGLYDQDGLGAYPGNTFDVVIVQQIENSTGLLPNDRTHVVKVRGARGFDSGLSVGAYLAWMSGTPLNERGPSPYHFLPMNTYLVKRGSAGRTPSVLDLNLRATYDLPLSWLSSGGSRVVLDVLHIGSPRKAVSIDQVHYTTVDQNGDWVVNPTYGDVLLYQPPMTVRLGIEVEF